jgi:hypothetical protein
VVPHVARRTKTPSARHVPVDAPCAAAPPCSRAETDQGLVQEAPGRVPNCLKRRLKRVNLIRFGILSGTAVAEGLWRAPFLGPIRFHDRECPRRACVVGHRADNSPRPRPIQALPVRGNPEPRPLRRHKKGSRQHAMGRTVGTSLNERFRTSSRGYRLANA